MGDVVLTAGDKFDIAYPFSRSTYEACDEDGYHTVPSWRPGAHGQRWIYPDDCISTASAMGGLLLEIVSLHKPGKKWPERVFYVRQWRSPDGKVFGRKKLRIATIQQFKTLLRGYRHDYEIERQAA